MLDIPERNDTKQYNNFKNVTFRIILYHWLKKMYHTLKKSYLQNYFVPFDKKNYTILQKIVQRNDTK